MEVTVVVDGSNEQGNAECTGLISEQPIKRDTSINTTANKQQADGDGDGTWCQLIVCIIGLQVSYLIWGVVQERVMTSTYGDDKEKFPSATFCVFSNRVCAILLAMALVWHETGGTLSLGVPLHAFAPPSISNTLSSFGQYEALHYVSFPMQTLSKSTKVLPVMLMGTLLNNKSYPWVEYLEAILISFGVCIFALGGAPTQGGGEGTALWGVLMLVLYVGADSFTAQYQSKVYKKYPGVSQYQMMMATNTWSIFFTMGALIVSGELWSTLEFLNRFPSAIFENVLIAVTSATGQLFIFYTIKKFGADASLRRSS